MSWLHGVSGTKDLETAPRFESSRTFHLTVPTFHNVCHHLGDGPRVGSGGPGARDPVEVLAPGFLQGG